MAKTFRFLTHFKVIILILWHLNTTGASPATVIHTVNSPNIYETVELTNPIRLEPVDLLPYETVLKLIISVDLPKFDLEPANQVAENVYSSLRKEIELNETSELKKLGMSPIHRPICRAPINSVLSKVSSSMVGSEDLIQSYIHILNQNKIPGFSTVVTNSTYFSTRMSDALSEVLKDGEDFENVTRSIDYREPREISDGILTQATNNKSEISESEVKSRLGQSQTLTLRFDDKKALHFSSILRSNLKEAAARCQARKMPTSLVDSILQKTLSNIVKKSNNIELASSSSAAGDSKEDEFINNGSSNHNHITLPQGYKLVICPDKFSLYAELAITDCLFSEKKMYVIVNVPLVRRQSRWQLYQSHHSKFIFDKKVCSIGSPSPSLTSKLYGFDKTTRDTIELISSGPLTSCQFDKKDTTTVNRNKLCFIPHTLKHSIKETQAPSSSKTSSSFTCAAGILNKISLKDLKDVCNFKCHEIDDEVHGQQGSGIIGDRQYFEQISKNQILLANVRSLKVSCPNGNFSKIFERIGTLKITLKSCDCYVWADDRLYSFPCDEEQYGYVSCKRKFATKTGTKITGNDDESGNTTDIIGVNTDNHFLTDSDAEQLLSVSYLVPMTWTKNTKYNILLEENLVFKIKNHKEIIDFDWYHKPNGDSKGFGSKYWNLFQDDYPGPGPVYREH